MPKVSHWVPVLQDRLQRIADLFGSDVLVLEAMGSLVRFRVQGHACGHVFARLRAAASGSGQGDPRAVSGSGQGDMRAVSGQGSGDPRQGTIADCFLVVGTGADLLMFFTLRFSSSTAHEATHVVQQRPGARFILVNCGSSLVFLDARRAGDSLARIGG